MNIEQWLEKSEKFSSVDDTDMDKSDNHNIKYKILNKEARSLLHTTNDLSITWIYLFRQAFNNDLMLGIIA